MTHTAGVTISIYKFSRTIPSDSVIVIDAGKINTYTNLFNTSLALSLRMTIIGGTTLPDNGTDNVILEDTFAHYLWETTSLELNGFGVSKTSSYTEFSYLDAFLEKESALQTEG